MKELQEIKGIKRFGSRFIGGCRGGAQMRGEKQGKKGVVGMDSEDNRAG